MLGTRGGGELVISGRLGGGGDWMTRVGNELMIYRGLGVHRFRAATHRFTDSPRAPPLTDSPIHQFTNSPRVPPLTDSPIHRGRRRSPIHRFTNSPRVPPLTDSPIHRGRRRSPIHRFTNSPRALPLTDSPIQRGNPFTDAPCTANAGAHEGR